MSQQSSRSNKFYFRVLGRRAEKVWPLRDSNTQPSDLESDALPLRQGVCRSNQILANILHQEKPKNLKVIDKNNYHISYMI